MSSTTSAFAQDASSPSATFAGLTSQEAEARLSKYGPNDPASKRRGALAFELLHLFLNPLVIILLIASGISALLGEKIEAEIIFVIVVCSITLDFVQTYRSQRAIQQAARTCEFDRDRTARRPVAGNKAARDSAGRHRPVIGR